MTESNNPFFHSRPDNETAPMLSSWQSFMNRVAKNNQQNPCRFPHEEIKALLQTSSSSQNLVTLKQLLQIVPYVHEKYQRDYESFREIILLLYVIISKKGCCTKSILAMAASVLENLLRYRAILICSSRGGQPRIGELYIYLREWLGGLVPKLMQHEEVVVQMFRKIYQKNMGSPVMGELDHLVIIFEVLLLKKVVACLSEESLQEFGEFMSNICQPARYQRLKQFIRSPQKLANRETVILDIQLLVPLRADEEKCEVSDLLIHPGRTGRGLIVEKVKHCEPIEQWVMEAYLPKQQLAPIDVSFPRIWNMRALELYRFLCLLEIYGSSPNIDVLDDYLPNEEFLQFFSRFLLGEELCAEKYRYGNTEIKEILDFVARRSAGLQKTARKVLLGEMDILLAGLQ